ncbi:MAG: transcriptional repressor [Bacteroidales bacterium]|nr:transcriptional repressor [Bacteroidales bacterium]
MVLSQDEVIQLFSNFLQQKGLRKTSERYIIVKEIYNLRRHFDVDTLFIYLKNKKIHISKATLYSTLDLLVEAGLVVKHQFGEACAQYEPSFRFDMHDHAICIRCKQIIEFSFPDLDAIKEKFSQQHNFIITSYSFILYGICSSCKVKDK